MRPSSTLLAIVAATLLGAAPARAAWPGDNGRILFSSANRLFTVDPAGGTWTRLITDETRQAQAAWSPDGKKVAFRVGPDGDSEIWVVNADGTGAHQITTTPNTTFTSYSSQPAWSPDGRSIVFRSDRRGDNADIWIMNADGTDPRLLLATPGDERYPALSPDGTRLVYRTGDPPEIWVAHADGSAPVQLTNNALFDSAPAWSPDGTRLAFERGDPGADVPANAAYPSMEIWTMAADGSVQRQLTTNAVHDEGAAWAPDGSGALVFTRDDKTNSDLYIRAADGTERRLTDAPSLEESPDWQALPRAGTPPAPVSTAPATSAPSRRGVPLLALRTTRARVSRTGRFVLRLECTARCSGTLRVARRNATLARARFAAPGARTLRVRLRLRRPTLRRLRTARRLTVDVRLLRARVTLLAPR